MNRAAKRSWRRHADALPHINTITHLYDRHAWRTNVLLHGERNHVRRRNRCDGAGGSMFVFIEANAAKKCVSQNKSSLCVMVVLCVLINQSIFQRVAINRMDMCVVIRHRGVNFPIIIRKWSDTCTMELHVGKIARKIETNFRKKRFCVYFCDPLAMIIHDKNVKRCKAVSSLCVG